MDQDLRVFKDDVDHLAGRQLRRAPTFSHGLETDSLRHAGDSADTYNVVDCVAGGNFLRYVRVELSNRAIDSFVLLKIDYFPDLIESAATT